MKLLLMTSLENVSLEWCKTFHSLEHYKINRCYKPNGFGKVKQISLHHFSDASQEGYGQVSYLRMVNNKDEIHCYLLMGKARVIPRKFVSRKFVSSNNQSCYQRMVMLRQSSCIFITERLDTVAEE